MSSLLASRLSALRAQAGCSDDRVVESPVTTSYSDKAVEHAPALASIRERLERLQPHRAAGKVQQAGQTMDLPALAERLQARQLCDGLLLIHRSLPLSHRHGNASLSRLTDIAALPDESQRSERYVYIDTETTGLSGGTGTLAYLVGAAFVDGGALHSYQWLLTRFSAESTMLNSVAELFGSGDTLVSYNGKSFDLPLLQTRVRLQAQQPEWHRRPHLDLLHPVRRLFKQHWPDCKLTTVERLLLDYQRVDDLPGAEAPQAWFDYVHSGFADKLIRIVAHNFDDILSLAMTHAKLASLSQHGQHEDLDCEALARWLAKTDRDAAIRLLQQQSRPDLTTSLYLATLLKQQQRIDDAIAIWDIRASSGCQNAIEELAKIEEHHHKNIRRALLLARQLDRTPQTVKRISRLSHKAGIDAQGRQPYPVFQHALPL